MIMKLALFTLIICAFIGLLLVSNPFGADAMRMVATFVFPFLVLIGFGVLLFDLMKKAAK
ncbi:MULTISPECIES: hypothetical protein [Bacillus]|uniref:hypothetical protein n=1 Tax=Bacillus TaxID=1386 RepID=UPI00061B1BB1|nr:hypothetical protein [Bacillus safensis]ARD55099.1 hypothetical protein BRL64_02340 [Bacillus safensis]KKD40516.1 hypothetical protein KU48_15985 [Bacillus safensis]MBT2263082.1 hypothetical protein [Bacillus safensis]MBU8605994.1 hypothetical protein [Bacillus safensis]MBU8617676.1 hypothetical protein [Bacillus safensis]